MKRILPLSGACAMALLCASIPNSWADEAPAPSQLSSPKLPPLPDPFAAIKTPPTFNSPTISLITTPSTSKTEVATFLKTSVSFRVKDASFLTALDAVLGASPKTCSIECRQIKPMKVSFGAKSDNVGLVLDTLAKMGGASLWVLPNKLLLSPADLLSNAEKASARPFSVLVSKATLPQGKSLVGQPGQADILALMNKKITASVNGGNIGNALTACEMAIGTSGQAGWGGDYRPSLERIAAGLGIKTGDLSLSFEDVTLGEALWTIAHADGGELYLLPGRYLICPPGSLTPAQQKVAVPGFSYPGISTSPPSAPKS